MFYGLTNDVSRKMFHMHLRIMCALLLLDGCSVYVGSNWLIDSVVHVFCLLIDLLSVVLFMTEGCRVFCYSIWTLRGESSVDLLFRLGNSKATGYKQQKLQPSFCPLCPNQATTQSGAPLMLASHHQSTLVSHP